MSEIWREKEWDDEELACVAALAGLPGLGAARLTWLLGIDTRPSLVWRRVVEWRLPAQRPLPGRTASRWRTYAEKTSPTRVRERYDRAGVRILTPGSRDYPSRLFEDPEAPPVLFAVGDLRCLDGPTAAVVGTRRCTGYGRDAARLLGRRLAEAGVVVVSGLAAGIDVAAHRGALAARTAPVVGVAGTGLDVVYPPESRDVWAATRERGVLLSEAPLGHGGARWRFPERNRIMAALADVVVVVESPARGGSLITVDHAARRAVPVMAVPGPITSPTSAGPNRLVADGCGVVCDADDVLLELGVPLRPGPARRVSRGGGRPEPASGEDRRVLAAVDATPTAFDRVMARTEMAALDLASALYRLEADGWVRAGATGWERRPR